MNKLLIVSILALLFLGSCSSNDGEITTDIVNNPNTAAEQVDPEKLPSMTFDNELFEFGEITQGESVSYSYTFTNTGKTDLIITSAKGSCGCTVPEWPKTPIKPGEKSQIDVVFNSEGKKGRQHKKVTVLANTQPSTNVVALSGEVIAPDTN
jgi:hypothetical protein|tara:strand:+ start:3270 stop:3725 length:456 start_codon:yes stop_codon:yes gene_type:complete